MNTNLNLKNNDKLSILGFGAMRFPVKDGRIDYDETERMLLKALELGVNYFDTAYFYHDGESETVLGRFFAAHGGRTDIKIATKLPISRVKKLEDCDTLFNEQLKRLQTDYVDYYLLHCVGNFNQYERLKNLGVVEWAENKRKEGKIKNFGYSYHGPKDDFLKILCAYPWDFVQIQYNYLDEHFQAGKAGLLKAKELGIPVIVMEPLQGGNITHKLPAPVKAFWESATPTRTLAAWGLKWVWNQEGVLLLLSGMSAMEQLTENCETAATSGVGCLTETELGYYEEAKRIHSASKQIPCTGCTYCLEHCKRGVNISGCFAAYNQKYELKMTEKPSFKRARGKIMSYIRYVTDMGANTKNPGVASNCIACRACEPHCPQQIQIADELKKVTKFMETGLYKIVKFGEKMVNK